MNIICACSHYPQTRNYAPIINRTDNTVLLLGCVIVESYDYVGEYIIFNGPKTIILAYQSFEWGKRVKQIWIRSDSLGYFSVPNMPHGKYAIIGVEVESRDSHITLRRVDEVDGKRGTVELHPHPFDHYWEPGEPWIIIGRRHPYPKAPSTWEETHERHIVDFGYLVITTERISPAGIQTYDVNSFHFTQLSGNTFLSNKQYDRIPIRDYFYAKYPNSEWAEYIKPLQ